MADLPSFHLLNDGHTVAVHSDVVQQLEQDGLNVQETFQGLLTVNAELFEGNGPINDEYCWMHDPGGWSCSDCFLSDKEKL
jgi:hypothetical protein